MTPVKYYTEAEEKQQKRNGKFNFHYYSSLIQVFDYIFQHPIVSDKSNLKAVVLKFFIFMHISVSD